MAINIEEYKALYLKTTRDLIDILKTSRKKLMIDACDTAAIAEFHRAAHSLKSQSLVMGYTKTGIAAKVLEHLFAAIKEEKECLSPQNMPLIGQIVSELDQSLERIGHDQGELDMTTTIEQLSKTTKISLL